MADPKIRYIPFDYDLTSKEDVFLRTRMARGYCAGTSSFQRIYRCPQRDNLWFDNDTLADDETIVMVQRKNGEASNSDVAKCLEISIWPTINSSFHKAIGINKLVLNPGETLIISAAVVCVGKVHVYECFACKMDIVKQDGKVSLKVERVSSDDGIKELGVVDFRDGRNVCSTRASVYELILGVRNEEEIAKHRTLSQNDYKGQEMKEYLSILSSENEAISDDDNKDYSSDSETIDTSETSSSGTDTSSSESDRSELSTSKCEGLRGDSLDDDTSTSEASEGNTSESDTSEESTSESSTSEYTTSDNDTSECTTSDNDTSECTTSDNDTSECNSSDNDTLDNDTSGYESKVDDSSINIPQKSTCARKRAFEEIKTPCDDIKHPSSKRSRHSTSRVITTGLAGFAVGSIATFFALSTVGS